MANNLILEVIVGCGNLSCQKSWISPHEGKLSKCPVCGWKSTILIEKQLRKEGIKYIQPNSTAFRLRTKLATAEQRVCELEEKIGSSQRGTSMSSLSDRFLRDLTDEHIEAISILARNADLFYARLSDVLYELGKMATHEEAQRRYEEETLSEDEGAEVMPSAAAIWASRIMNAVTDPGELNRIGNMLHSRASELRDQNLKC